DRLAAARRRGGAPDLEGGLGAFDDPLVVGFGGGGDAAERLAGGRIDRFERAGAGGGPFAVAEESAGFLGPKAERGEDGVGRCGSSCAARGRGAAGRRG